MKRILSLLLILVLSLSVLVGCGEEKKEPEPQAKQEEVNKPQPKPKEEKSQDEINQELKEAAVKAVFTEINGNEDADGTKVYVEGEISVVDYDNVMDLLPSFTLSQNEGDGYGMYHITNALSHEGLKDGDIVIAYGVVDGVSDTGIPRIVSTLIEVPKGNESKEDDPEKETTSQKNAVGKAEQYISTMPFSKKGLVEQLEFDDFEEEDAIYGVSKINIDWNEQAEKKAEQYIDTMPFSKEGLIEQLKFDGFEDKEAKHGVENITVDWKEQAVKKGEAYLDTMNFSKQGLIDQLKFDGFSGDEANHAVDKLGF